MRTLLKNCHLVSPGLELFGAALLLDGELIKEIVPAGIPLPDAENTVDIKGLTVVPGFIDIHCHGRGGADFCDGTIEAMNIIGKGKLEEGVTGFLATTMTVAPECLEAAAHAAAVYRNNPSGAKLLGIHLEGPFINPACAGAQNLEFIRLPDIGMVDKINNICPVKIVSFSPELPGGLEFTRELVKRGIMPSGAHSAADYQQFLAAREAGMRHLTHFCNVMTPLHHLRFGMVGGAFRSPDVKVEIIADGVHLCDEMIELIFRLKTTDGIMLITDAIRAAAMPDGDYDLGGLKVKTQGGRATLQDGTVAGSTARFFQVLRKARDAYPFLCPS